MLLSLSSKLRLAIAFAATLTLAAMILWHRNVVKAPGVDEYRVYDALLTNLSGQ